MMFTLDVSGSIYTLLTLDDFQPYADCPDLNCLLIGGAVQMFNGEKYNRLVRTSKTEEYAASS
jgi:hypothetical protein